MSLSLTNKDTSNHLPTKTNLTQPSAASGNESQKELKVDETTSSSDRLRKTGSFKKLSSSNLQSLTSSTTTMAKNPALSKLSRNELERSNSEDTHAKQQQLPRLTAQYSQEGLGTTGSAKKRARTMYAPVQMNTYGPKATLKKVTEDNLL